MAKALQHSPTLLLLLQPPPPPSSSTSQASFPLKPLPHFPSPVSSLLFSPSLRLPFITTKANVPGCTYTPASAACSCDDSDDDWDDTGSNDCFHNCQLIRDCDELIDDFMVEENEHQHEHKHALANWRRLLVLNKKWNSIRHFFFTRCQDRARNEDDPWTKDRLLWLANNLKQIDDDVQRHNDLIQIMKDEPSEISEIVSTFREDLTREFFVHLHTLVESYNDNPEVQNNFVRLWNTCLVAVEEYDAATQSIEAIDDAQGNLQNMITSRGDASSQNREILDVRCQCFGPELVARWLRSCYDMEEVGRIHAIILKCFRESATYVDNNLICSYLRLGNLTRARRVFDKMSRRDVVTWTAIIDGYLNYNLDDEALNLFRESIKHGVQANSNMLVCVMNLCGKRLDLELGKQIHAHILKSNWRNLIVDSAVVHFYARCEEMSSAFRTFDRMAERDVVCWTTMITACSQQRLGHESLLMFSQMLGDGFFPNEYTVCAALKACGENKELKFGTQLHGAIVKKLCKSDVFVGTSLIDMYAKCGEVVNSKEVFDRMRVRNTATWTSIISGYARKGYGEEALSLFRLMKRKKVHVNKKTIASVTMACGSVKSLLSGKEVHAQIIKSVIHDNVYLGTSLVWFYCKCKEYSHAFKVLQHMPSRDVVLWTAIISGCAKLGLESEALQFLQEMMEEGVVPNAYTYSSLLKACANLEAPMQGRLIHSYASKTPALSNVFVNSALIYMYAKCGYVADALQVFDNMPERNLVSWKAMILGYARNGHCQEALKLMYRMQAEGFEVDDYILATVYTASGGGCEDIDWDIESSSRYWLSSESSAR
ncbi:pentatricopeptide repeat-containing protein At4g18520, chloroplastic-like isoform X3 [Arachis stenosperma]|uniref:pentatricopeptide repeat-containing protein At4g18520, chloroplastic-like isoform X3 n=1 Tax=Arachis stenosperma TaxID=217475 RepID=UPI0025AD0263|nr:pentatricopeptide repeat-containing protein At4g18520, chloroplastic-like isoform X3 [Arachis stenosperma]